jgi:hypothetical protein
MMQPSGAGRAVAGAMPSSARQRQDSRGHPAGSFEGELVPLPGKRASVALSVSDEGVGMNEKERRCIFEPF